MTTYQGRCFCGAVTFEADGDLSQGTLRCNCNFCRKMRYWEMRLPDPQGFRLTAGCAHLAETPPSRPSDGAGQMHHYFCRDCGTRLWTEGDVAELGGFFRAVFVPALEVDAAELVAAPVAWLDGLHDNWFEAAPETRHL